MKQITNGSTLLLIFFLAISNSPVSKAFSGCPGSGQQSVGPDLILGSLGGWNPGQNDITNYTSSSGIEAFAIGTTACNMGDTQVVWEGQNSNHPVIAQNFFRFKTVNGATRIEHLGQSWLKHGFAAVQFTTCCTTCQASPTEDRLGVGCADPYTSGQNGTQTDLSPKWQVNATTGVHIHPVANPSFTGTVARRLQIKISDLEASNFSTSATKYFAEAQYITSDEALAGNGGDNPSYRPITVSGSGTNWTFGLYTTDNFGQTRHRSPGILAWTEFDTGVHVSDVVTPEDGGLSARVIVAGKATSLGNGVWHYEYAVQNVNSDRSIFSFAVPVSRYATLTNIGFHDVDYHSGDGIGNVTTDGTDWPAIRQPASDQLIWSVVQTFDVNPNGNALRWGTMYNFRFDCDQPPAANDGTISMSQFKTGAQSVNFLNVVPDGVSCIPGDMNGDGSVDGLDIGRFTQLLVGGGGTASERCAGDREASSDGIIDTDDIDGFVNCVLAGGC